MGRPGRREREMGPRAQLRAGTAAGTKRRARELISFSCERFPPGKGVEGDPGLAACV